MRLPQRPPVSTPNSVLEDPELLRRLLRIDPLINGAYLHWDEVRHRNPPEGLTHEQWWYGLKIQRSAQVRNEVPLTDAKGQPFRYGLVDPLPERLHQLDQRGGGTIRIPEPVVNPEARNHYLVRSLIEEAFSSSQLEGAATTREIAKQMVREHRQPRTRGERMVLNNYRTLERILELRGEPLSKELVFEIQRTITTDTLDDPTGAGRLRRPEERVVVCDPEGVELHVPPPAEQLETRMERMCAFANGTIPAGQFVHPAIRSMILHFWLAYDHPFKDGNGRTARALFYWSMLRHDYWMFEFISISHAIHKAPTKYGRAFLHTETDDNDLTYFLLYHVDIIQKSVESLHQFVQERSERQRILESRLRGLEGLNYRQRQLIQHAVRHPGSRYTFESHGTSHQVTKQTARTDLLGLVEMGLLRKLKSGRAFHFLPVNDLEARLQR